MQATRPTYSVETLHQLASAGSEFYQSLLHDYHRHGGLTLAQIETLRERPLTTPAAFAPMPREVNVTHLEKAFAHARSKGTAQPSITLFGFKFMPADPQRAQPANRDAIFVTQQAPKGDPGGAYLGKVLKGEFHPSRLCTDALSRSIRDAMDDPYKAAVEFGHMTGQCSVCMRPLSNPESVKLGIGPICRAKFGW